MRKKCNIIQINGLSGILLAIFAICCAITGFIAFPSWLCMHAWNFAASYVNFPVMNIYHGAMLWLIIALIFVATHLNKTKPISFGTLTPIDKEEMKRRIEKLQAQNVSSFQNDEENAEKLNKIKEEN